MAHAPPVRGPTPTPLLAILRKVSGVVFFSPITILTTCISFARQSFRGNIKEKRKTLFFKLVFLFLSFLVRSVVAAWSDICIAFLFSCCRATVVVIIIFFCYFFACLRNQLLLAAFLLSVFLFLLSARRIRRSQLPGFLWLSRARVFVDRKKKKETWGAENDSSVDDSPASSDGCWWKKERRKKRRVEDAEQQLAWADRKQGFSFFL